MFRIQVITTKHTTEDMAIPEVDIPKVTLDEEALLQCSLPS
jgi:hypothetical protein